MEEYIRISTLNDFIFCPKSIYFHQLYDQYAKGVYQDTPQVKGTINHAPIDYRKYSSSKDIIQALSVYSDTYNLCGKIDLYHKKKKSLMERKTKITELYQGLIYQLYAQYFCMIEMGYEVEKIQIYSMEDNTSYEVALPDEEEIKKFEMFLKNYREYTPETSEIIPNPEKCQHCIYHELCDIAVLSD